MKKFRKLLSFISAITLCISSASLSSFTPAVFADSDMTQNTDEDRIKDLETLKIKLEEFITENNWQDVFYPLAIETSENGLEMLFLEYKAEYSNELNNICRQVSMYLQENNTDGLWVHSDFYFDEDVDDAKREENRKIIAKSIDILLENGWYKNFRVQYTGHGEFYITDFIKTGNVKLKNAVLNFFTQYGIENNINYRFRFSLLAEMAEDEASPLAKYKVFFTPESEKILPEDGIIIIDSNNQGEYTILSSCDYLDELKKREGFLKYTAIPYDMYAEADKYLDTLSDADFLSDEDYNSSDYNEKKYFPVINFCFSKTYNPEDYILENTFWDGEVRNAVYDRFTDCYAVTVIPKSKDTIYEYLEIFKKTRGIFLWEIRPYTVENQDVQYVTLGDINADGEISLTDLTELSLAIIGDKTFTEDQLKAADINKNGKADLPDLARLQQYLSKKITSLG